MIRSTCSMAIIIYAYKLKIHTLDTTRLVGTSYKANNYYTRSLSLCACVHVFLKEGDNKIT